MIVKRAFAKSTPSSFRWYPLTQSQTRHLWHTDNTDRRSALGNCLAIIRSHALKFIYVDSILETDVILDSQLRQDTYLYSCTCAVRTPVFVL